MASRSKQIGSQHTVVYCAKRRDSAWPKRSNAKKRVSETSSLELCAIFDVVVDGGDGL